MNHLQVVRNQALLKEQERIEHRCELYQAIRETRKLTPAEEEIERVYVDLNNAIQALLEASAEGED